MLYKNELSYSIFILFSLCSRAIPKAFRGLPITLVYIGVLALAIYGFTGHSVIL